VVDLTKKGRWLFESGADDVCMSKGARLFLEVLARTGPIEEMEADRLCDELEELFGSSAKAIAALRSGEAILDNEPIYN
jgi:hypothetical protein